jgi:hypothetical protein
MYVKRDSHAKGFMSTNTDFWSGQEIDIKTCRGKKDRNFEKT